MGNYTKPKAYAGWCWPLVQLILDCFQATELVGFEKIPVLS